MGCDRTLLTLVHSSQESWFTAVLKWDYVLKKELSNLPLGGLLRKWVEKEAGKSVLGWEDKSNDYCKR